MTATGGDQCVWSNLSNTSPARLPSEVVAAKDDLIVNAKVTYAPLVAWKDFHWTCTVTSIVPPVQDRLE
jgi:hypothetical protein